jgi:hypothetical protein
MIVSPALPIQLILENAPIGRAYASGTPAAMT